MSDKLLTFDASSIEITPGANHYFSVELRTQYLDEVLDNFTPDEIISDYGNLGELYTALQEHFNLD